MDKANIIISIIIVLCIAAAVAAYGITNSDSPIFSDLSSMGANDNDAGNGLGNSTAITNGSDSPVANSNSGANAGSGSSGSSSSGTSSSGSSSSGSSSSGSGSSSSGSSSSGSTKLSYSQAKSIASDAIAEQGCYAGSGYYSNGYWIFTIYDSDGNAVDSIGVNDATGMTERV